MFKSKLNEKYMFFKYFSNFQIFLIIFKLKINNKKYDFNLLFLVIQNI